MSEKKLLNLKTKRQTLVGQQDRVKEFVDKKLDEATVFELEARSKGLEKYYIEFQSIQSLIEEIDNSEGEIAVRASFEELYFSLQPSLAYSISKCDQISNGLRSKDTTILNTTVGGSTVKLPKFILPTFSGDNTKWTTYFESFTSLIDNNESIDSIAKFHYLISSLSGQPLRCIESIDITAKNYDEALNILKARYANTSVIVEEHVKRLLNCQPVTKAASNNIRDLIDTVNVHLRSLTSLGRPVVHWDDIIICIVLSKLDSTTNEKWIDVRATERLPTLKELFKFLDKRCQQLDQKTIQHNMASTSTAAARVSNRTPVFKASFVTIQNQNQRVCTYCSKLNHLIYRCRKFLSLTSKDRLLAATNNKLCINCLRCGHDYKVCESQKCRICQGYHHTLLHAPSLSVATLDNSLTQASSKEMPFETSTAHAASLATMQSGSHGKQTLLATAVVCVLGKQGQKFKARAILDPGSQLNLMTDTLALQLAIPRYKSFTPICGVEETSTSARHILYTQIQSLVTAYSADLSFHILSRISEPMPNFSFDTENWKYPSNVILADPDFNKPSKIDILIGAEIFYELLLQDQIRLGDSYPHLQNTQLGYIAGGPISFDRERINTSYNCNLTTNPSIASIEKIVRQFWELEGHSTPNKILTEEERLCEQHFLDTVRRSNDGRFIVRLPFRNKPSDLGSSLQIAQRRLFSLERKLKRQPELKQQYILFMNEYESLQHMHKLSTPLPVRNYFLPHHCIIKSGSSSTKVRVVFDASAKSTNNVSLNDILMTGPTVQSDLFTVLTRFRTYRWVFTTDIKQMYRQIEVDPVDRPYQMIAWRSSPDEPVEYFELNTITYGTSAAPFLATRCLNQLAIEEKSTFPFAANSLLKETYVDDIMTGAHNLQDAFSLQNDLIKMLEKARFELRKFCSNELSLLSSIPENYREPLLRIGKDDVVKTLGLAWEPVSDSFKFHICFDEHPIITKRSVLSDIGKIFDPLGLIGPVTVVGKIFLQELWKLEQSWDQPLPPSYQEKWYRYTQELELLHSIKIPRHLLSNTFPINIQLHAFSDSSERAYGACCYLRCEDENGKITTRLICSKSRVAPTKSVTLPRLELCAALLMIELVERLQDKLPISINKRFLYTDSKIVLAWIARPSYTWQTFVANRVAKIQELSRIEEWKYVHTKENPADILSRGAMPELFVQSIFWDNGPKFLQDSSDTWQCCQIEAEDADLPDRRHITSILLATHYLDLFSSIIHRGSWHKLNRIIGYCFRFQNNALALSRKTERNIGPLTIMELEQAHNGILSNIQRSEFNIEYSCLLRNKEIDGRSRLKGLNPFLDKHGLIRVTGRLQNSLLPNNSKHQIILPKHDISKMLINSYHFMYLHAGPQMLLAALRQRYWPIDGKHACRNVVHRCFRCIRTKPTINQPLMGNLPAERVQPGRPFFTTGIDFCGPIRISSKIRGRAPIKAYICVFICFTTKAIHLEVVSDLSTEAFIASLRRFIGRRGICKTIFSDNATNFVGAKNDLSELYELFQKESHNQKLSEICQQAKIEWSHIPPRSPHFGGLWEAAVKTAKYHLIRVLGSTVPTFEELCTLVVQIEAIVNSRPITPLSDDPGDLEALTPGHFLIGGPLTSFPEPDISDVSIHRLSRFRRMQQLQQVFWKRWSSEYLHSLQQRHKWSSKANNLKLDALVVLQDDNLPPYKWALGRVLRTIPGRDGIHRVAEVKTANGVFKRAVAKLCPIPIED